MAARDPRVDPKLGDVLRKDGRDRTVQKCVSYGPFRDVDIHYYCDRHSCSIFLRNWRKWAKDAEVLHAAD